MDYGNASTEHDETSLPTPQQENSLEVSDHVKSTLTFERISPASQHALKEMQTSIHRVHTYECECSYGFSYLHPKLYITQTSFSWQMTNKPWCVYGMAATWQ